MAASPLKRAEAVVWLPPRSDGERAFGTEARLLAAHLGPDGQLRTSRMSLDAMQGVRQVRLVFDPRDVALIPAIVPALSGPRLAQALPNIVEDSLLQDAAGCAMVAGPPLGDGRRTIAVVDRAWLEFTVGAFERRGISVRCALPAPFAVPMHPKGWSLACVHGGIALRTERWEGLGWPAGEDPAARAGALCALLETALLDRPRPESVAAWVDDEQAWAEPLAEAAARLGLEVSLSSLPVPPLAANAIDLLGARAGAGRRMLQSFDWRDWRWPAGLATACLVAALVGLNLHWAAMARERQEIRAALEQRFRGAFPEAQVVVDPVLQMSRQVALLRARSGQSGPDDFMPLLGRFAQAIGPRANDAVAAMEYRDGVLRVRFQPQRVEGRAVREQLVTTLSRHGLQLRFDNDRDPSATVAIRG
jgi:general secretion pathway protein L